MVFEFIVATVFFLAIIMYVISHLNLTVSVYGNEYHTNSLESKAIEISEMLVKNPGVWNNQIPLSPGLALEWPVLNQTKIMWLCLYCNTNYEELAKTMNIDSAVHGFQIEITEDGNPLTLLGCGQLARGIINAEVERIALSESGNLLRVTVWTW